MSSQRKSVKLLCRTAAAKVHCTANFTPFFAAILFSFSCCSLQFSWDAPMLLSTTWQIRLHALLNCCSWAVRCTRRHLISDMDSDWHTYFFSKRQPIIVAYKPPRVVNLPRWENSCKRGGFSENGFPVKNQSILCLIITTTLGVMNVRAVSFTETYTQLHQLCLIIQVVQH